MLGNELLITSESPEKRVMSIGEVKVFGIGGLNRSIILKNRHIIPKNSHKYALCGLKFAVISLRQFCLPFFTRLTGDQ